jgi:hypothetical protein
VVDGAEAGRMVEEMVMQREAGQVCDIVDTAPNVQQLETTSYAYAVHEITCTSARSKCSCFIYIRVQQSQNITMPTQSSIVNNTISQIAKRQVSSIVFHDPTI